MAAFSRGFFVRRFGRGEGLGDEVDMRAILRKSTENGRKNIRLSIMYYAVFQNPTDDKRR